MRLFFEGTNTRTMTDTKSNVFPSLHFCWRNTEIDENVGEQEEGATGKIQKRSGFHNKPHPIFIQILKKKINLALRATAWNLRRLNLSRGGHTWWNPVKQLPRDRLQSACSRKKGISKIVIMFMLQQRFSFQRSHCFEFLIIPNRDMSHFHCQKWNYRGH